MIRLLIFLLNWEIPLASLYDEMDAQFAGKKIPLCNPPVYGTKNVLFWDLTCRNVRSILLF